MLVGAARVEGDRLRSFRRRWLVRNGLMVGALLVLDLFVLGDLIPGSGAWFLVTPLALPFLVALGLAGTSLLLIPLGLARIVAILRTDDLAAFERRHA